MTKPVDRAGLTHEQRKHLQDLITEARITANRVGCSPTQEAMDADHEAFRAVLEYLWTVTS